MEQCKLTWTFITVSIIHYRTKPHSAQCISFKIIDRSTQLDLELIDWEKLLVSTKHCDRQVKKQFPNIQVLTTA